NSYGKANGAGRPNTRTPTALATSCVPPRVMWSLPAPSTVTPRTDHFAGHSTRYSSFAPPPHGDRRPRLPHPSAQATLSGAQTSSTSPPDQETTVVVPIRPQRSHSTWIGHQ